jgi:hypothetical protein
MELTIEQLFAAEKYRREIYRVEDRRTLIDYIETVQQLNQQKSDLIFELFAVAIIIPRLNVRLETAPTETLQRTLNELLSLSFEMDSHVKLLSRRK